MEKDLSQQLTQLFARKLPTGGDKIEQERIRRENEQIIIVLKKHETGNLYISLEAARQMWQIVSVSDQSLP